MLLLFPIFFAATAALLAWLFIFFHPARPWDFQPVGDDGPPPETPQNFTWPGVAIIVPARNEADSLPRTLTALLQQDYPGKLRVFVVDDRSTDGTARVAEKIAEDLKLADWLEVLEGKPLPENWAGKVWAMDQGAKAALADNPEFFLLTDADILHAPASLRRLVAESVERNLGLNSRMAKLRCESPAERLLIPAFVFFFNLLYPMRRVNNPKDTLAGAAGGCQLLSREAVENLGGGFESIRNEIIDDVNLARQIKARRLPIRLSLSRGEVLSLREYPALGDIWKMVRRTAFTELRYSWLRLAGAMAGLALMFFVPTLAIFAGICGVLLTPEIMLGAGLIIKGVLALAVMGHVYAPAMRFFKLPALFAFSLPIAGVLYGAMTLDSAFRHAGGRGIQWRENQPQTAQRKVP